MRVLTAGRMALAMALAILTTLPAGSPAWAVTPTTTTKTGLYWCIANAQTRNDAYWDPNDQCVRRFAEVAANTAVTVICWLDGRVPSGESSRRWFYAKARTTAGPTYEGFIYTPRIADPPRVGHCSMRRELATTGWATDHLGQVITQNTSERAGWPGGPVGEWSGDCVHFVRLAWWKRTYNGNAYQLLNQYAAAGKVRTSGTPPRGALVLWSRSASPSLGHAALSVGNGWMVTTQSTDGAYKPIVIKQIKGASGWVAPADIVVSGHNPQGFYDSVAALGSGRVRVRGWSWDASNSGVQLGTHVYVGGKAGQSGAVKYDVGAANAERADVHRVFHSGRYHGISKTFSTSKRGSRSVCLYALNTGPGSNVLLGCKTINIT